MQSRKGFGYPNQVQGGSLANRARGGTPHHTVVQKKIKCSFRFVLKMYRGGFLRSTQNSEDFFRNFLKNIKKGIRNTHKVLHKVFSKDFYL